MKKLKLAALLTAFILSVTAFAACGKFAGKLFESIKTVAVVGVRYNGLFIRAVIPCAAVNEVIELRFGKESVAVEVERFENVRFEVCFADGKSPFVFVRAVNVIGFGSPVLVAKLYGRKVSRPTEEAVRIIAGDGVEITVRVVRGFYADIVKLNGAVAVFRRS